MFCLLRMLARSSSIFWPVLRLKASAVELSGGKVQFCNIINGRSLCDAKPESVVNEVAGDHLVEEALPVAVPPGGGEAFDLSPHLGPVLHHLALDVELEGVLPEVGVHDLARGLTA